MSLFLARDGDGTDRLFDDRQFMYCDGATGLLVDALLDGPTEDDVREAEAAVDGLAAVPVLKGLAIQDVTLLRLRALLARARGDAAGFEKLADEYREMANSLGFEGHIALAEAMR